MVLTTELCRGNPTHWRSTDPRGLKNHASPLGTSDLLGAARNPTPFLSPAAPKTPTHFLSSVSTDSQPRPTPDPQNKRLSSLSFYVFCSFIFFIFLRRHPHTFSDEKNIKPTSEPKATARLTDPRNCFSHSSTPHPHTFNGSKNINPTPEPQTTRPTAPTQNIILEPLFAGDTFAQRLKKYQPDIRTGNHH
jgi:hypothetical protein